MSGDWSASLSEYNPRNDLIASASEDVLRSTMKAVCQRDRSAHDFVVWRLHRALNSSSSSRVSGGSATEGGRAKRGRSQTCAGCRLEYDEKENREGVCSYYRWHPRESLRLYVCVSSRTIHTDALFLEEPEMDSKSDAWVDWDEGCHPSNFEEVPDGYRFFCCDKDGTAEGCEKYMHVPSKGVEARGARTRRC